jgi:multidrug resistance efflux pump
MKSLPPIPIPPEQRWRDLRIQVVPAAVFLTVLTTIFFLWNDYVAPATMIGEVEVVRENVVSPKAGVLVQLNVASFQNVKEGDIVANVVTTDPKIMASSLGIIQAEINLLRHNMDPVIGRQRFELSQDRVRLDWMQERANLATARVQLQLAEDKFRRTDELYKDQIVAERVFEQARSTVERFRTEVEERTRLVAAQEKTLEQMGLLEGSAAPTTNNADETMRAAIAVQEQKLRLAEAELSPIDLPVPIDGMVSMVYRRSGETVMAGEPILTISAPQSDRIIGHLRQPITLEPRVGMTVEVRSRSMKRQVGIARVIQVGSHMEPLNPGLLPMASLRTTETGLPVLVNKPPEMKLRPGELVELTLIPN